MKYRDYPDWISLMNSVMLWNHLKTVIYFVITTRYIAIHTHKQTREMTFSLSRHVVMNQIQQVWQHMLPAFSFIMKNMNYTPARHDWLWCQTARDMTWIKCRMRVFKHSYRSSVHIYIYTHKKTSTKCDISSCQQLTMVEGCKDVSPKTENAVLIMAKKRCIA